VSEISYTQLSTVDYYLVRSSSSSLFFLLLLSSRSINSLKLCSSLEFHSQSRTNGNTIDRLGLWFGRGF